MLNLLRFLPTIAGAHRPFVNGKAPTQTWSCQSFDCRPQVFQSSISILLVMMVASASQAAASTTTFLTNASQLATNDTALNLLTANVVGGTTPASVGSVYSGSSITFSNSNNALTFSGAANGYEIDQVGATYGSSAYSNGTILLGAGGFQGSSGGPVTLTFAVPVSQFGLDIEDFNTGPYTLTMSVFDTAGANVALGYSGNDASLKGNDPSSLSFEGLSVTGDNIKSITFDDGTDNLMFGNLEYLDVGASLQAPPAPEPGSVALLGFGLLGLAWVLRNTTVKEVR